MAVTARRWIRPRGKAKIADAADAKPAPHRRVATVETAMRVAAMSVAYVAPLATGALLRGDGWRHAKCRSSTQGGGKGRGAATPLTGGSAWARCSHGTSAAAYLISFLSMFASVFRKAWPSKGPQVKGAQGRSLEVAK